MNKAKTISIFPEY